MIAAKRVGAITRRLLQQLRRDRRTLALLFVAPLIILGLIYFLLRGGSQAPLVGVVNQDSGPLGGMVAAQLIQSREIRGQSMSLETAETRLRQGHIDGFVLLPAGFSLEVSRQRLVAPQVNLEGSQPGAGATIGRAVQSSLLGVGGPGAPHFEPRVTYLHGGPGFDTLDYFGPAFIGLILFFLVFVITTVAFLRERTQGTLERLMASPLRRGEVVLGYMLGFSLLALLQGLEVLLFSLYALHIHNSGQVWLIFGVELVMAVSAVNLGIFLSMFARTEFQAVQFIPIVVVPQMLLAGVIFPIAQEPSWLQLASAALPLTYAVNALQEVMVKGSGLGSGAVQLDLALVIGFCLLTLAAAGLTLQRRLA